MKAISIMNITYQLINKPELTKTVPDKKFSTFKGTGRLLLRSQEEIASHYSEPGKM
jgi:hypothetical protein